jgi:hypothetical protein
MFVGSKFERSIMAVAFACAVGCLPHVVNADDAIDPSLIPDGAYPAHVDRVISPQHLAVTMQGTLKVFLDAARSNINFSDKVKANDDVVVTLVAGKVTAIAKK